MKLPIILLSALAFAPQLRAEPPVPVAASPYVTASASKPAQGLVASAPVREPAIDRKAEAAKLIARKQLDAAEALIVAELAKNPRDPGWITLLAEVRLSQGRAQEALRLFQEANQMGGTTASRAMDTAFAALLLGRSDIAEPEFHTAARLSPLNPVPHYFLARFLYNRMRYDEAIRESKKAISLSPGFVRAYENVGLCYEAKHNTAEAEHWYLEAIRRNATSVKKTEWPALDLASMLIQENRLEKAKPYLEEALAINPRNAQALEQMGIILEKRGDIPGALKEFQGAIQADTRLEDAYYQAGRMCKKLGDTNEAMKYFDKLSEIHEETQGLVRSWSGRDPAAY